MSDDKIYSYGRGIKEADRMLIRSILEARAIDRESDVLPLLAFINPESFNSSDIHYRLIMSVLLNMVTEDGAIPTRDMLWSKLLKNATTDMNPDVIEDAVKVSPTPDEYSYVIKDAAGAIKEATLRTELMKIDQVMSGALDTDQFMNELLARKESFDSIGVNPLGFKDVVDILTANRKFTWLIEDIMVKGSNFLLAGKKKCLKTGILLDMAVSLATGSKFLNHFDVPEKCRVAYFAPETSEEELNDRISHVITAKNVAMDIKKQLFFSFQAPKLADDQVLASIKSFVKCNSIDVVIIDPIYLCILGGAVGKSSSILADMGPIYSAIGEAVKPATCVMAHHFKKSSQSSSGEPDLDDMSGSGAPEWCRQSLMITRRGKYSGPTTNEIECFTHGHARRTKFLARINETSWSVRITTDVELHNQEAQEIRRKHAQDQVALTECIAGIGLATKRDLMDRLKWNGVLIKRVMESCLEAGVVVEVPPGCPENSSAYPKFKAA